MGHLLGQHQRIENILCPLKVVLCLVILHCSIRGSDNSVWLTARPAPWTASPSSLWPTERPCSGEAMHHEANGPTPKDHSFRRSLTSKNRYSRNLHKWPSGQYSCWHWDVWWIRLLFTERSWQWLTASSGLVSLPIIFCFVFAKLLLR